MSDLSRSPLRVARIAKDSSDAEHRASETLAGIQGAPNHERKSLMSRREVFNHETAIPLVSSAADHEPDATEAQWAAIEFAAWQHSDDEWKPPTNEEWRGLSDPHLINLRIAWLTMHKTKPELIRIVAGFDTETGGDEKFMDLLNSLDSTGKFFEALTQIMMGAWTRLMVAATAHCATLEVESGSLPESGARCAGRGKPSGRRQVKRRQGNASVPSQTQQT